MKNINKNNFSKNHNEKSRTYKSSYGKLKDNDVVKNTTVVSAHDVPAGGNDDLCWGRNPVILLLEDSPLRCLKVIISRSMQRGTFEKITTLCKLASVPYSMVELRVLDGMVNGENHQGVVAVMAKCDILNHEEAINMIPPAPAPALIVLLDHIQDPHNLGAIIRSAEAAGASFVAFPLRRSSLPTGTVIKTSAGASLRLPLVSVGNVANAVKDFQQAGFWAIGLDGEADRSIFDGALPHRTLLVVGGEDKGLTRTTEQVCDEILRIPICGTTGSLNASVALSIGMFEWVKNNYLIKM